VPEERSIRLNKQKSIILVSVLLLILLITPSIGAKEETITGLPGHELGDSTISLSLGLFVPLFFQDFTGYYYPGNSSLGGTGTIQWSAYLNNSIKLGLEFGGAFSYDPNGDMYWLIPITFRATYVFSISRFEFPIFLGTGIDLVSYKALFDMLFVAKPGFGAFWRFDTNLSFGLNFTWWFNIEFGTQKKPAIMGNFADVSAAVMYHF
jgi:hypothetical protein